MAQDVTYNITSSDTFPYQICYVNSGQGTPVCSDYDYLIVTPTPAVTPTGATNSYFLISGFYGTRVPTFVDSFYQINSYVSSISLSSFSSNLSSLTLTLTDKTPTFGSISGILDITENGSYDVTNYAQVDVAVPATEIPGDYHDDLVNINQSILICGAVLLVLYFFYCIYRLIIKNTGGS